MEVGESPYFITFSDDFKNLAPGLAKVTLQTRLNKKFNHSVTIKASESLDVDEAKTRVDLIDQLCSMSELPKEYIAPYFGIYCAAVQHVLPLPHSYQDVWTLEQLVGALDLTKSNRNRILCDWYNMCIARQSFARVVGDWYRASMDFSVNSKLDAIVEKCWGDSFCVSGTCIGDRSENDEQKWCFTWTDYWQQTLFAKYVIQNPVMCAGYRPTLAYEKRTILALQKRTEMDNIEVNDVLWKIGVSLLQFSEAKSCETILQPGKVNLGYKTYSTWNLSNSQPITQYDETLINPFAEIKDWSQRGVTVKANEAISNVGLSLWPSAFLLAEYSFCNLKQLCNYLMSGNLEAPLSVIELGAGTGLSAALIRHILPITSPYYATDYSTPVVELMHENFTEMGFKSILETVEDGIAESQIVRDDLKEERTGLADSDKSLLCEKSFSFSAKIDSKHAHGIRKEALMNLVRNGICANNGDKSVEIAEAALTKTKQIHVSNLDWENMNECVDLPCDCEEVEIYRKIWQKFHPGIIIAADCIYAPELCVSFSKAVYILLKAVADAPAAERVNYEPFAIVSMQLRAPETYELFLKCAAQIGLCVDHVPLDAIPHLFVDAYERERMIIMKLTLQGTTYKVQ